MNTTEAQREQWALALGWSSQKNAPGKWHPLCWVSPSGDCYEDGLPDFAALDGPYVGPAIKELVDAGWIVGRTDKVYDWWDKTPWLRSRNYELGICTMNALLALRAT